MEADRITLLNGLSEGYGKVYLHPYQVGGDKYFWIVTSNTGSPIGRVWLQFDLCGLVVSEIGIVAPQSGRDTMIALLGISEKLGVRIIFGSTSVMNFAMRLLFLDTGFEEIGVGGEGIRYGRIL